MKPTKLKKLLNILQMDELQIFDYLYEELLKYDNTIWYVDDRYLYMPNPKSTVALVAHMDTVAVDYGMKELTVKNNVLTSNGILGADDRAGVYGILEILQMCKRNNDELPNIIFCHYEESGRHGVQQFVDNIKDMSIDVSHIEMLFELDRMNCNDYVFYYNEMPTDIKDFLESYGYAKAFGSFSDVSAITTATKIPHANLSIGYYGQHTAREKLHLDEMEMLIVRTYNMLNNILHDIPKLTDEQLERKAYVSTSKYYGKYYESYDKTTTKINDSNIIDYEGCGIYDSAEDDADIPIYNKDEIDDITYDEASLLASGDESPDLFAENFSHYLEELRDAYTITGYNLSDEDATELALIEMGVITDESREVKKGIIDRILTKIGLKFT